MTLLRKPEVERKSVAHAAFPQRRCDKSAASAQARLQHPLAQRRRSVGIPAHLISSAETAPVFMDAPPNREHLRVSRRMDYVLLPAPQPSTMSTQSAEEQASSPSTYPPRYSRDGQQPLGRGHRVKKPNIRLSSTLSETDEPENIPKRPRPTPKASRRSPAPEDPPVVRIWCHQCHQNRSNVPTIACIPCGKSYCSGCLARRCVAYSFSS